MFRNNLKLMIVLGLLVGNGLDIQAAIPKKKCGVATKNVGNSKPRTLKEKKIYAKRTDSPKKATKNGGNARKRSAAFKVQVTKAGIDLEVLEQLIDLTSSTLLVDQFYVVTNVDDVSAAIEALEKKIQQTTAYANVCGRVIERKHWKHFRAISSKINSLKQKLDDLEKSLKPQLAELKQKLAIASQEGSVNGQTPVRRIVVDLESGSIVGDSDLDTSSTAESEGLADSEQTQALVVTEEEEYKRWLEDQQEEAGGGPDFEEDDYSPQEPIKHNLSDEQVSYVQQILQACAQEKGMVISAGTIGVCFVVAGTCFPLIIPSMATGTVIGAGVGGVMSVVCGCDGKTTAKNMVHGAVGGTVMPLVGHIVTPVMVGGSLFAEGVLESAVTGFITGAATAEQDHERLSRAFQGAACGAVVGSVLYGLQNLYNVSQQPNADIQALRDQVRVLNLQLSRAVAETAGQQVVINKLSAELQATQRHIAQLHNATRIVPVCPTATTVPANFAQTSVRRALIDRLRDAAGVASVDAWLRSWWS